MKNFQGALEMYIVCFVVTAIAIVLLQMGWVTQSTLLANVSKSIIVLGGVLGLSSLVVHFMKDRKNLIVQRRIRNIKVEETIDFREAVCEEYEELIEDYALSVYSVKKTWILLAFSPKTIISVSIPQQDDVQTSIWFLSHENKWLTAQLSHLVTPVRVVACKNEAELKKNLENSIRVNIRNQKNVVKSHAEKLFIDTFDDRVISSISPGGICELNFRGISEIEKIFAGQSEGERQDGQGTVFRVLARFGRTNTTSQRNETQR